jgi:hypothetical protein
VRQAEADPEGDSPRHEGVRGLDFTHPAATRDTAMRPEAHEIPRCPNLDGSSLFIVPAYTEAGFYCEANCITVTDGERTVVYVPAKAVDQEQVRLLDHLGRPGEHGLHPSGTEAEAAGSGRG